MPVDVILKTYVQWICFVPLAASNFNKSFENKGQKCPETCGWIYLPILSRLFKGYSFSV